MECINIAGSSNGRTTDFGSVYLGSNPSPAANSKQMTTKQSILIILTAILVAVGLAYVNQRIDDSLAIQGGTYQFEEFVQPNQNWLYKITLSNTDGKWNAQISIDGFQTITRLNAVGNISGKSLEIVLDSYGADNIGESFEGKGDLLFVLTPTRKGLQIDWIELKPVLPENNQSSILTKVSN